MKFEQIITLYGTVVVDADNENEAREKVMKFLEKLTWGDNRVKGMEDVELIIGEFERENDLAEMK